MRNRQRSIIYFGIVLAFLIVSMGTVASASVPSVDECDDAFDISDMDCTFDRTISGNSGCPDQQVLGDDPAIAVKVSRHRYGKEVTFMEG